jgi:sulfopyruvate decarboxylase subunit alpha
MNYEEYIYKELKSGGVDFVVHIPDKILLPLINLIEASREINSILVAREEEGIAICAGLFMSGHSPVMVMQSSGLGNSISSITSILQAHSIPLLIIISLRGGLFEYNPSDVPLGRSIERISQALAIPYYCPFDLQGLSTVIAGALVLCKTYQGPVIIALQDGVLQRGRR